MKQLKFQSLVQYRIPVKDECTCPKCGHKFDPEVIGNPEILKKFTSPLKETKAYNKKKKVVDTKASISGEVTL